MKSYYNYMYSTKKPFLVTLEENIECPEGCVFYEPYCFEDGARQGIQTQTDVNQEDLNLLCDILNCPPNQSEYNFKSPFVLNHENKCVVDGDFDSFLDNILNGKSSDDFDPYTFIKCWPQIWLLESGSYVLQQINNEAINKREMYIKFDRELERAQKTFIENAIQIKKLQKDLKLI